MEPAVIVIFEVLPVVVVEPCVQRKSTQMVFFPGPDIFLLCFCQGIFFILIIFIFILLFVLFLILFLLFVLFFLVLFFFRFFLRFLLLFGGSLFGGVFQLFGFSGVPAVFFSRFVLVSICGFLVLAGFCCVLRSAVFGRFRGFVFGKGFGGIGGGSCGSVPGGNSRDGGVGRRSGSRACSALVRFGGIRGSGPGRAGSAVLGRILVSPV